MSRLTKPQQALLDELLEKGPVFCVDSYPPAKRLVELGLAEWRKSGLSERLVPKEPTP